MPKKAGLTIGFLGTGTMAVNPATELIEEEVNSRGLGDEDPVRFIFPLTTNEFTDTMADLVNMANASEILYEVVRESDDKGRRTFTEVASKAVKTYDVPDVFIQIEHMLVEASPNSMLLVLWDDKRDEELQEICGGFIDADIDVRDLTDNMTRLGNEPDEQEQVMSDGAQGVEGEEEEEDEGTDEAEAVVALEAEALLTRAALEKMSRDEIRTITVDRGLPPKRSSAAMIDALLESQGVTEAPVVPPVVPEVVEVVAVAKAPDADFDGFRDALEDFGQRFSDMLDHFLVELGKVIDGAIFNATPAATPEPVVAPVAAPEPEPEAQPRRRLVRR